MSDKIVHTSDSSFETDVINADKPVLLDFWAEWCGPCKMIAPLLDEVAEAYADKLSIVKMNIDENQYAVYPSPPQHSKQLFGPVREAFEQKFSKNSNA